MPPSLSEGGLEAVCVWEATLGQLLLEECDAHCMLEMLMVLLECCWASKRGKLPWLMPPPKRVIKDFI